MNSKIEVFNGRKIFDKMAMQKCLKFKSGNVKVFILNDRKIMLIDQKMLARWH